MAKPLLADVAHLATLMGWPVNDARLALALRRASGRFYGDTNRDSFGPPDEPVTEFHNGTGGDTLLLKGAPVVGPVAVTVRDVPAGAVDVDRDAGILRLPGGFPRGLGNVAVTYRHGYPEVPDDVQDAVLEHAATLASVMAHLQQEGGGATQASYSKQATVGTTAKWVSAVSKYNLQGRG